MNFLEALKEELKVQGLPQAELLAEVVVKAVAKVGKDALLASGSPYVKVVGPILIEALLPELLKQVDKIDGQAG